MELLWEQGLVSDSLYAFSPFSHANPMQAVRPGAVPILILITIALTAIGVWCFGKRDIVSGGV
jgi:putative exporter of polyketide antibiotics